MAEVKFGFIPGVDQVAYRIRRRYRLQKGGHPQLVLVHYSRGQPNRTSPTLVLPFARLAEMCASAIVPAMNQPVRSYPLRPVNEPAIFVMGERQGQKVYSGQEGPTMPPGSGRPGMTYGIPGMPIPGNPQAMLAQQNSNMEALERRRQRAVSMGQQQVGARIVEEDDSAGTSMSVGRHVAPLTIQWQTSPRQSPLGHWHSRAIAAITSS